MRKLKLLTVCVLLMPLTACYGFWCDVLTEQGKHNCYGTPLPETQEQKP